MKKFIQENFTLIVLILSVLTLFKSCGDSREVAKLRKELETTNQKMEKYATKEQVEIISSKTMFDFLLYEDDLDKKKTSLSDIKNKLDELQKKLDDK
jgi:CII-binding regulator of phage lambda lysogenization HflD